MQELRLGWARPGSDVLDAPLRAGGAPTDDQDAGGDMRWFLVYAWRRRGETAWHYENQILNVHPIR